MKYSVIKTLTTFDKFKTLKQHQIFRIIISNNDKFIIIDIHLN